MKTAEAVREAHTPRPVMSLRDIRFTVPSVFNHQPAKGTTDGYVMVQTNELVKELSKDGFELIHAAQVKARTEKARAITRHAVYLRVPKQNLLKGFEPELVILNAHDRSISTQLYLAVFDPVTLNRYVVAEPDVMVTVRHYGKDTIKNIRDEAKRMVSHIPEADEAILKMKGIKMSGPEQTAFAKQCLLARWPAMRDKRYADFVAAQLLQVRNGGTPADDSLWSAFSRIHENLFKGGIIGITLASKMRSAKAVVAVDTSLILGTKLWNLARAASK